jgi:hypothetical protein
MFYSYTYSHNYSYQYSYKYSFNYNYNNSYSHNVNVCNTFRSELSSTFGGGKEKNENENERKNLVVYLQDLRGDICGGSQNNRQPELVAVSVHRPH